MEIPLGAERFTFPDARPSSPPATPGSSRSRNASATSYTASHGNKRYGFINLGLTPPENLEPKGASHHFSNTPPDREDESSDSSTSEDFDLSEAEGSVADVVDGALPEVESEIEGSEADDSEPVRSVVEEETDFTLEELSENDIGYDSDTEVVKPDQTEDAASDKDATEVKTNHEDLLDALKNLHCDPDAKEKAQEFAQAQRKRYRRKKNRWSRGLHSKRSHAESVGSDSSENADIELVEDIDQLGSEPRRVRRRTVGPSDAERPRTSLLLEKVPAEIEELGFDSSVDAFDNPPNLVSDSDEGLTSDEEDLLVGEEEDMLVPSWLMDVDSDISRPSTAATSTNLSIETPIATAVI